MCIQVFSIFEDLGISVDVVATSEVSVSLTLDPSKLWSRELIQQASVRHFYIAEQFVDE
jgi:aspartate kinase